eukprot:1645317-Prymnesium_polylepis.1
MTYRLVQTRSRRAPRVPDSLRTRRHFAPRPSQSHAPPACPSAAGARTTGERMRARDALDTAAARQTADGGL